MNIGTTTLLALRLACATLAQMDDTGSMVFRVDVPYECIKHVRHGGGVAKLYCPTVLSSIMQESLCLSEKTQKKWRAILFVPHAVNYNFKV